MLFSLFAIVFTYLIASIPFGVVFAKYCCNKDILTEGSGNIGATNVARVCGKQWGALVLVADFLKGFLPLYYFSSTESSAVLITLLACAAVVGHSFSCFLGFKGGKSVATTLGIWMALAPLSLLFAILVCLYVIWHSRYVSAGSLSFALSLPVFLFLFHEYSLIPLAVILLIFIFLRHKSNIERILQGTERRWE